MRKFCTGTPSLSVESVKRGLWSNFLNPATLRQRHIVIAAIHKIVDIVVRAIYPAPQNIEAPYALPDGIANDYIEAEKNLQRRNFTSAGMMFRRVLERATKHLAPGETGKRLKDRIALLAEQHRITPEVRELAECLRDDGMVAAHEEEAFTELGANQMRDFTHLFLMYTFALPQFVDDARAKGEPPK